MSFIKACTRKKTYAIHIISCDAKLVFEPNAAGDVVCDVQNPDAVEWLLAQVGAFTLYGDQPTNTELSPVLTPAPAKASRKGKTAKPETLDVEEVHAHVLCDAAGVVQLDLRTLSYIELHAFAETNGIALEADDTPDVARDKIVAFLSTEE
jgi:hypothetical protein